MTFTNWANLHGIKTELTSIDDAPSNERCLRVKRRVSKGETILNCPYNMLISTKYVLENTKLGPYLLENVQYLDPMQLLMSFIVIEKAKGVESFWFSFIQSLPKLFTLTCSWNETLLSLLPPEMVEMHQKRLNYVINSCEKLDKVAKHFNLCISTEDIVWAFGCVNSRCFKVPDEMNPLLDCTEVKNDMVLVPYLDMCNHEPENSNDYHINLTEGCSIVAGCDLPDGSEVFLHYGSHNNYFLLVEYGFFLPNNTRRCVIFTRDDILSAFHDYEDLILKSENFPIFCGRELFVISNREASWHLTTMLSALPMDNLDNFQEMYLGGFINFQRQPELLKTLCDFKRRQYECLLEKLEEVDMKSEQNQVHGNLLKQFLNSQIEVLDIDFDNYNENDGFFEWD